MLLLTSFVFAVENQVSLNGFFLHQYANVATNELGQPYNSGKTDKSAWKAYDVQGNAYIAIEILNSEKHYIYSIQLTGNNIEMEPFLGLVLGDDKSKVLEKLGNPTGISHIGDSGAEHLEYRNNNFSIEISPKGKLWSIRIHTFQDMFANPSDESNHWAGFERALKDKNFKELTNYFRPDIEIYKNNEIYDIKKSFKNFQENPSNFFLSLLFADSDSVLSEVLLHKPESELRLVTDFGVGRVYKFYKSKILKEIVFFPFNGKYKIYEIRFLN